MANAPSSRKIFFRAVLFLVCAVLILFALNTLYSFTNTLHQLDAIEADRDQWQRPSAVIWALDLREGNTVVDLGSGAGYFTLKLSVAVGKSGQVLAVDLRKLSLFFLWTRAIMRGHRNVDVIVGTEDDPRLPAASVDAVLVCNTFHEFSNPQVMLEHVFRSLRPGGRIVIVDRAPRGSGAEHAHDVPLSIVNGQLRLQGFEIVSEDDHFIERPSDDPWWLMIARKPSG